MTAIQMLDQAAAEGKFFSVDFIKKDNSYRRMNARAGVNKHHKGGISKHDPEKNFVVYDMKKEAYRTVPLDRIVSVNGKLVGA